MLPLMAIVPDCVPVFFPDTVKLASAPPFLPTMAVALFNTFIACEPLLANTPTQSINRMLINNTFFITLNKLSYKC